MWARKFKKSPGQKNSWYFQFSESYFFNFNGTYSKFIFMKLIYLISRVFLAGNGNVEKVVEGKISEILHLVRRWWSLLMLYKFFFYHLLMLYIVKITNDTKTCFFFWCKMSFLPNWSHTYITFHTTYILMCCTCVH